MKNRHLTSYLIAVSALLLCTCTPLLAQTTEGRDFWVTFLRADADNPEDLTLTFSTKQDCQVTLENKYTEFAETVAVNAGILYTYTLNKKDCYTSNSETVSQTAVHITSTADISVFAGNYRTKSFDAANILPASALRSEYIAQAFPASDHDDKNQGTHFGIVAIEDNTVVKYVPTTGTYGYQRYLSGYFGYEEFSGYQLGDTLTSDTLKAGEVWYVWSGETEGEASDLTGSYIKAMNNKPVAVFLGDPHTNIPSKVRDRDHIFEQAMPTLYWGTSFVVTGSMLTQTEKRKTDYVKITALEDETVIWKDGVVLDTIFFSKYPKRTITFELHDAEACYLESSCPVEVFLYMTSNRVDDEKGNTNGDPAMVWINPVEQRLSEITFASYKVLDRSSAHPQHFVNIVTETDNVGSITLDGTNISSSFKTLTGNPKWSYAQYWLGNNEGQHTLRGDSGFIAHAYGYGEKESYAYSAGGATKPLTQAITINGEIFTPETNNTLCGKDTITFACKLNYDYENITWNFGDGSPSLSGTDSTKHYYEKSGLYKAYVLIQRYSSNVCVGQSLVDSIPITVNIGRFEFEIGEPEEAPCKKDDEVRTFRVPFNNISGTSLEGDNVHIGFNKQAQDDGFTQDDLEVLPDMFVIEIPETATAGVNYGINIRIESDNDCGETDTTLYFRVNYEADDILVQRFDNVLGLLQAPFEGEQLSDFRWYKDSVLMENEQNAVLYLSNRTDTVSEYYVCFTINKGTAEEVTTCSCPKKFKADSTAYSFKAGSDSLITISYQTESVIYVNTEAEAEAHWIKIDGQVLTTTKLPEGGGLIDVPTDEGLYILRVITGKQQRNFKILIYNNN